jgi:PAS domain S-box-containing protein
MNTNDLGALRDLIHLNDSELQVLMLLAQGKSNKQIAQCLGVNLESVKAHMRHILEKLSASGPTQVAIRAPEKSSAGDRSGAAASAARKVDSGPAALRAVEDSAPCLLILLDPEGVIKFVSQEAAILFGYSREEILQMSVEELIPLQSDQLRAGKDIKGRRRDGSEFLIDVSLTPIYADNGINVLATIAAANGRQPSEEILRLNLLIEQRDQFFAALAHDLKSPLCSCNRLLDLLLEGGFGPLTQEQSHGLRLVRTTSRSIMQRLQNLVDQYRLERAGLELYRERVDIEHLVLECCREIAPLADSRNIRFAVSIMPGIGPVETDAFAVFRILQNLLDNARKFSPPDSTVEISVRSDEGRLLIDVSDCGPGVSPENQQKLFRRFWQSEPGRRHGGSGLGLYVSRTMSAQLGGNITYCSREGGGAVFSLILNASNSE